MYFIIIVKELYYDYLDGGLSFSEVDSLTGGEQEKIIEEGKNLAAGLMNGRDNNPTIPSNVSESLNDREGRSTVKSTGGFIKKQDMRSCEDF